jgi:hypothetical protein
MTDKAGYPQAAFGGDTIRTVTLTPQEQAAYASGWNRAIEAAARIQDDGNTCRACGTFFIASEGHYDEDCPKGRASWDGASEEQKACAILALSMPAPVQAWQTDMNAMPRGVAVLAALSNGWHEIITDRSKEGDYAGWYIAHGNVSLPIERTHPSDTNWGCAIRAVAWMPLPAPPAALIPDTEGGA